MKLSSSPARPATVAILVHGIGPFDRYEVVSGVRSVLSRAVPPLRLPVYAYDWRAVGSNPMSDGNIAFNSLAAMTVAVVRASLVAPVSLGQRSERVSIFSVLHWLVLLASVVAPLFLFIPAETPGARAYAVLCFILFPLAVAAGGLQASPAASLRQTGLPVVWAILCVPIIGAALVQAYSSFFWLLAGLGSLHTLAQAIGSLFRSGNASEVLLAGLKRTFVVCFSPLLFAFWIRVLLVSRLGQGLLLFADILLYAGDPAYRRKLVTELAALLERVARGRDVVIVSHSLGSVIAVDALLRHGMPENARSITLVTMGSPLRRFFARFFGAVYPGPSEVLPRLGANAQTRPFRWVNVYRPKDPVGTSLFPAPSGRDLSTGQENLKGFLWMKAHTGYWSDPEVLSAIREALEANPLEEWDVEESDSLVFPGDEPVVDANRAKKLRRLLVDFLTVATVVGFMVGAPSVTREVMAEFPTLTSFDKAFLVVLMVLASVLLVLGCLRPGYAVLLGVQLEYRLTQATRRLKGKMLDGLFRLFILAYRKKLRLVVPPPPAP